MATLKELRDERLRKLEKLKELGINPYPSSSNRTNNAGDIAGNFNEFEGKQVSIAGRIINIRKFGKIAFIVLKDDSGQIQLFLKPDVLEKSEPKKSEIGYDHINLLDSGDFIEAHGEVIKTKTGEISVRTNKLRILVKTLRGIPSSQEGFSNKEERLRRRYVDTNANQKVHDRFVRRSKFWQATRNFLLKEGFIEINTPVLEHTPGGADAKPFTTHMDALDQDFYLRISHELPLKRLLGGGYEKVFDIGPRFRNENYSEEHLPEHIAMEWYWAFADWEKGMEFTQRHTRQVVDATWITRKFKLPSGQEVDFGKDGEDWPRISFVEIMKKEYGVDVLDAQIKELQKIVKQSGIEVEKFDNKSRLIDKLWKKIRKQTKGPAFLINIPVFLQPLAKAQQDNPQLTEQFNLIVGGTEVCKAYSELNDPQDQLERFLQQQKLREAGDDEAQMMDIDFVEMLEYGMPPACGFGWSERLFWLLEGVSAREGVPFPPMRSETDQTTKSVYPEVFKKTKKD